MTTARGYGGAARRNRTAQLRRLDEIEHGDKGTLAQNLERPVAEGKVRCPECGRAVRTREDGSLRAHQTSAVRGRGVPCVAAPSLPPKGYRYQQICPVHGEDAEAAGLKTYRCGCRKVEARPQP